MRFTLWQVNAMTLLLRFVHEHELSTFFIDDTRNLFCNQYYGVDQLCVNRNV